MGGGGQEHLAFPQRGLDVDSAVPENEAQVIGTERGTHFTWQGNLSLARDSDERRRALHLFIVSIAMEGSTEHQVWTALSLLVLSRRGAAG